MAISYDVFVYIACDHLAISFVDKLGQNLTETMRISDDNRKVIVHAVIILSSRPPYINHTMCDARTMALWKSQGVGTLTVQLSCTE